MEGVEHLRTVDRCRVRPRGLRRRAILDRLRQRRLEGLLPFDLPPVLPKHIARDAEGKSLHVVDALALTHTEDDALVDPAENLSNSHRIVDTLRDEGREAFLCASQPPENHGGLRHRTFTHVARRQQEPWSRSAIERPRQ